MRWVHELTDSREYPGDRSVVCSKFFVESCFELQRELPPPTATGF